MFTRRFTWELEENAYTQAMAARRKSGLPVFDLTIANPSQAGFVWSCEELSQSLVNSENSFYAPEPRGLLEARKHIAQYYHGHSADVLPEQIHLTASTSEAYSWVLKLLTDPGDEVLVPVPSYPLLEFLAALECVETRSYSLRLKDACWRVDAQALEAAVSPRTRAILCVSPNNPTGSILSAEDRDILRRVALRHGLVLIVDEVFLDYEKNSDDFSATPLSSLAGEDKVPLLALGGLSKLALLPQMKLAWIVTAGLESWREAALKRLDFIADTYLSVNTVSQNALGIWFGQSPILRHIVQQRLYANEKLLRAWCCGNPHGVRLLEREAGWSAVLELPRGITEEKFVLYLAKHAGVFIHPGYFYDMPVAMPPVCVISLISREQELSQALPLIDEALKHH
ncbi:MAG: pyridoxal phosphate-dependent aminotransferase [Puniceicoccales bacterium]|jgi:aspartate/methionine/tyrosine aminotransferase|nr:pyridoxal phosphate-dependent aminotransferase [Puniceicoccales bacterium]